MLRGLVLAVISVALAALPMIAPRRPVVAPPRPVAQATHTDGMYLLPLRPRALPLLDERSCVPELEPWIGGQGYPLDLVIETGKGMYADARYELESGQWATRISLEAGDLARLFALERLPCHPGVGERDRWFQFSLGMRSGARFSADTPLGRAVAALAHDLDGRVDAASAATAARYGVVEIRVTAAFRNRRYDLRAADGSVVVHSGNRSRSIAMSDHELAEAAWCIAHLPPAPPSRRPGLMISREWGELTFELGAPVDPRLSFLANALEDAIAWDIREPPD